GRCQRRRRSSTGRCIISPGEFSSRSAHAPRPRACQKEGAMHPRLFYDRIAPDAFKAMLGVERYLGVSSIEPALANLVRLRASQTNGCAYCIDMHWKDLRAAGETEQRLYGLDAWRESPYYTDRERAALEWTEAVTRVAETHASDAAYDAVRPHFTDK